MSNEQETICVTSQKEAFPCCVCGRTIKPCESYLAIGCHIDCAGENKRLKDIIRTAYEYLEKGGRIECGSEWHGEAEQALS